MNDTTPSAPKAAPLTEAEALARAAAQAMWAADDASRGLGMELLEVGPGRARLAMTVRADMVNGHDICHGGFIFTLADSAFAFACNTYNQRTVAQSAQIVFVAPARRGDRLIAECSERARFGRNGIYDATVKTEAGVLIAEFRGQSRTIAGTHVPEPTSE